MKPQPDISPATKVLFGIALALLPFVADAATTGLSGAYADASVRTAAEIVRQKRVAARAAKAVREELEGRDDGWGAVAEQAVPKFLAARVEPDYSFTPGHLCTPSDPNFQEYRYDEHIPYCARVVTHAMKAEIAAHYGVPETDWSGYEFDHLIPLAIGGDSSIDNLWPQPHGDPDGSQGKDRLEQQLYLQMKAGSLKQAEAVRQIYAWFTASEMARKIVEVSSR